jgi:hypothetical protein
MESSVQHTLAVLQTVDWKNITKPDLVKLVQELNLDQIAGENKEPMKQRLRQHYEHARTALQLFSPKSKSPSGATTPPAANDDKSPDPVPPMAALDDAVSPKQDTPPADVSMVIQEAVVREGTPPPRADRDTIQSQPELVKEAADVRPPMERLLPDHVAIALDRRLSAMEVNLRSLDAAYVEHVHQVSVFSKQVGNELKTTDINLREVQDGLQMVQHDITALRREGYRAERQVRADNVQMAQLGPHGDCDDKQALVALKMAGKSPICVSHFAKIGLDPKISRVSMASVAFTALEGELDTWEGTLYRLDRANQRPLCKLLRSHLPPELVTSILYASLDAAPRLMAADTYAGFKNTLLQVLIQLDLGTSSYLDFIQKQHQGNRTVTQHITQLRVFTDIIPSDVQHTQDFRKAMFQSFNYRVQQHLAHLNADWKTRNRYPDATELYQAACDADRFFAGVDEVDEGKLHPAPRVLAIQNSPRPARVWNIDQHLLQALCPEGSAWGPDYALDPEPCLQQEEYLCGALMEVNKLDITNAPDLQVCLRTVAKWLEQLGNGTWPARGFATATSRAAQNVQTKVGRQQQGLCWNCGAPGHLKAQCPKPHKRLTDHR